MSGDAREWARLASLLRRSVTGPMWHGPALSELLEEVTADQGVAYPVRGAHSIAELVLHVIAWAEVARQRMAGRPPEVTPAMDWPSAAGMDASGWRAARARLQDVYESLADEVEQLGDRTLDERVSGSEQTLHFLLHGVVEHATYHGGQIAILRKSLKSS
ncbi:MAG: DinB family protein [Gemmatimonadaceae bacterium]